MPLSILYCTSEFYGPPAVAFVTARFPPAFPSAVFVVIAVGSSRAIPVLIPWCLRTSACHAGIRTFSPRGRALDQGTAPLAFPAEIPGQSVPILEACPLGSELLRTVCAARVRTGCQLGYHNVRQG